MAFEVDRTAHRCCHVMVERQIDSQNQGWAIEIRRIEDCTLRICQRDRNYDFDGDADRHYRSGTAAKVSVGD